MKFTLSYEGELKTSAGPKQKAAIRRQFNEQLRVLWGADSILSSWYIVEDDEGEDSKGKTHAKAWLRDTTPNLGKFKVIPLATKDLCVECWLDFKILRSTSFKGHVSDIDNKVKVLGDTLYMPDQIDLMGNDAKNGPDEEFFVVMEDDKLVSRITATHDELLSPICGQNDIRKNDVRIMIDVHIRPTYYMQSGSNVVFFSDDRDVWDINYDKNLPQSLPGLSNSQLRSVATQCVFRVRALEHSYRSMIRHDDFGHIQDWDSYVIQQASQQRRFQDEVWNGYMVPKVLAIKAELEKRLFGGNVPDDERLDLEQESHHGLAPGYDIHRAGLMLDKLVQALPE